MWTEISVPCYNHGTSIQELKTANVRCSAIGLSAEVHVCKVLCEETGGRYSVAFDQTHLRDLLAAQTVPPPAVGAVHPLSVARRDKTWVSLKKELDSKLLRMGFPEHELAQQHELTVCAWWVGLASSGRRHVGAPFAATRRQRAAATFARSAAPSTAACPSSAASVVRPAARVFTDFQATSLFRTDAGAGAASGPLLPPLVAAAAVCRERRQPADVRLFCAPPTYCIWCAIFRCFACLADVEVKVRPKSVGYESVWWNGIFRPILATSVPTRSASIVNFSFMSRCTCVLVVCSNKSECWCVPTNFFSYHILFIWKTYYNECL